MRPADTHGIRVIDLSMGWAGPLAARHLAARVQALDAQGKTDEADMQREHFKAMWQFADVELKELGAG